jgi:hypothetical protein
MGIWIECLEIGAAVGPAVLSILLARMSAPKISTWFIKVIGTAGLSVLSLGMLLNRLTAQCAPLVTECPSPTQLITRSPGLFKSCQLCGSSAYAPVGEFLSQRVVDLQAIATGCSVLISSYVIIRFMLWARKTLAVPSNTEQ